MRSISSQASLAAIALCVTFAVFFYGGSTQFIQLGAVTLLVLCLSAYLLEAISQKSIAWSHLHTALLVYIALLTLNVFTSVFRENTALIVWLFLLMPIVVCVSGQLTEDRWLTLLTYLCIPLAFSAIWGVVEFFATTGRSTGPGLDPNSWSSTMNFSVFIFSAAFFSSTSRWSAAILLLVGLFLTASFMSYSRVGVMVLGAALIFVVAIGLTLNSIRRRALALLLIGVCSYSAVQLARSSEVATNNSEGFTLDAGAYGWTLRFAQWNSVLNQYSDYPLTGSGLGTFNVLYPQYRSLDDTSTSGNYAHNDYLQLLAEAGPGVIALVIAFIVFLLARLFTSVRLLIFDKQLSFGERDVQLQITVLVVGLGTLFVHALMNFTLYILLNQLLMGVVLARVLWLSGLMANTKLDVAHRGLSQIAVVLITTYILVVNYADAVSRDLVYSGGILPLDRHEPADQYRVFEILSFIRSIRGESSTNRFAAATFYRTSFDSQPIDNLAGRRSLAIAAALEYQSGLELNPYATDIRSFLSDFLIENPWLMEMEELHSTPESLLREGVALAPLRTRSYVLLVEFLMSQQRSDEAYEIMKQAIHLAPLRYDDYRTWRTKLQAMVLREANARGDTDTLRALLVAMG